MSRKSVRSGQATNPAQFDFHFIPKPSGPTSFYVSLEKQPAAEPEGHCSSCRKRATPCDECSSKSYRETPVKVKRAILSISAGVSSTDGPSFGTAWDGSRRNVWAGIRIRSSEAQSEAMREAGLTKTGWSSQARPDVSEWIWTSGDVSRWVGDPDRLAAFAGPKQKAKKKAAKK